MDEFITIALSYPTVVFSSGLVVVCVFWLLAIIGLADLEIIDIDFDISHETDASGFGSLSGLLMRYGLNGIPVTVIISLLVLLSWLFCYFASAYIVSHLPGSVLQIIAGTLLIGACLVVAFPITAMSLRPMKDVFRGETAVTNAELVGLTCEVRTGEVNETFGQGLVNDGAAGMLVDIRMNTPNKLNRGDIVALVAYNNSENTYTVMPEAEFMKL